MASYRDWVPLVDTDRYVFKEVNKRVVITITNDDGSRTTVTTYPIDREGDIEWAESSGYADTDKCKLLPAGSFQFALDFYISVPSQESQAPASCYFLMSIGSGKWTSSSNTWESHYEIEYFRAIFKTYTLFSMSGAVDWLGGGFSVNEVLETKLDPFFVVKYNPSEFLNPNDFPKKYDKNEVLGKITDNAIVARSGGGKTQGREYEEQGGLGWVSSMVYKDEFFPEVRTVIKSSLPDYGPPKSDTSYPIPEGAELRVIKIEDFSQNTELRAVYLRTLKLSSAYIYRHCAIDDVLGYDLISYTDKKKNLALSFSKDDKKWHSKIVIPANDPGIGIHPSIAVKDSGNIDYYWQKSGKAENATLGSEDVPPISGTGIAGVGIWSMRLNYIHDGDSGPISISNDAAGNRKENQIVAGGYNPVVVEDNQLGLDYLLYWSKSREDKDRIVTGSTGNAVPATITLGSIYAAIAKDGDFDAQPPVLILPHPNDPETAIPQQTVGAACKGNGDILLSWVDKDGTSYQQTVKVFEADAVVT